MKNMSKSLEERQKEWDEKYDSPNSDQVKSRPARPSKEEDDKAKNQIKTNTTDLLRKKPTTQEEEMLSYKGFPNEERIMRILSHIMFREIDLQIKRVYGNRGYDSRSTRVISLSKETPYGIAHFDRIVSLGDLHNRLHIHLEEGLSIIDKVESNLYDKRKEDFMRERDFFSRSPTGRRDY